MAAIEEESNWDEGVYQLETTDPVQGGPGGVDNLPHKHLANRTLWLKAQLLLKALVGGSSAQRFKVANAVNDDEAINKLQAEIISNNTALGIEQTWQNMTASRVEDTTYTNTTGKPIFVNIKCLTRYAAAGTGTTLKVDGQNIAFTGNGNETADDYDTVSGIVPNGSTYSFSSTVSTPYISVFELR